MNVVERFVLRVSELLHDRNQNQKSLRGDKSEAWISNIMRGSRGLRLRDADDIASALSVPLAQLIRRPDDQVYELTGHEARLVEAFRRLSHTEQEALLTLATLRYRKVGRPRSEP